MTTLKISRLGGETADIANEAGVLVGLVDSDIAEEIVKSVNAAPALLDALNRLFKECAMIHKYGGTADNTKEADAAIAAARALISELEG
jgi:hypothetical protein